MEFPPFYVNGEIASTHSTGPSLSLDAGFGVWDVGTDYNQPQTRDLANPAIGNQQSTEKEVPLEISTRLFSQLGTHSGAYRTKHIMGQNITPARGLPKSSTFSMIRNISSYSLES
uniref:Uncharacterized protein n=1 Tax=Bionectria ochroleuca TaxID=29856 RepID=A0A8H7KE00_BIOOC